MSAEALARAARALVAGGKGILAADESTKTMTRRLRAQGIESTAETRRRYREMLLLAPGAEEHISGVILYDETIRQDASDRTPFPRALAERGVLVGIKVDTGAKPLAGAPGETVTEGLDGLRERLAEYRELGARFAKWRAVIAANAHALARYAALCQEAGVVPIVEPEVLMEGRHTLERCAEVTERVLRSVFSQLAGQSVLLEGIVLKPNMVVAGADCRRQATVAEVADATLSCLRRAVPAAVPASRSCRGARPPSWPPRTCRRWPSAGRAPGSSRSPTGARCRTTRCAPGAARRHASRRAAKPSCAARAPTPPPVRPAGRPISNASRWCDRIEVAAGSAPRPSSLTPPQTLVKLYASLGI